VSAPTSPCAPPLVFGPHDGSRDVAIAVKALAERLPAPLEPLARLVFNYRWTWLPGGGALFRDIDPSLWKKSACNPLWMVQAVPPERLRALAADAGYVRRIERAAQALAADLVRPPAGDPRRPVTYVCSEYGAHCSLPLYGGGLGVLAGDVLKTASDLALPLVGVGLFYREGYFRQRLDAEGWQHEYWVASDPERLPAVRVMGADRLPLRVHVPLRSRDVALAIWRVDFGRTPLYLLDSDLPENHAVDRWITARLYIGDRHTRLAQYGVLGAGGVRALRAMGIEPALYHLNEGHGVLGVLERIAAAVREGEPIEAAHRRVRAETLFTTHTPVPAGNEDYAHDEAEAVLGSLRVDLGLSPELFYAGDPSALSQGASLAITPIALRASRAANGVSREHGRVARAMWQWLWPDRAADDVPIGHVTNGVHVASWMAEPMQQLLDEALGAEWRERLCDVAFWSRVEKIPDEALWAVRRALRKRLVEWVRERSILDRLRRGEPPQYVDAAARVFEPGHLTIGFARRVATYKRLHLLTRRLDEGLRLLGSATRPVQLVIAGKAHPQDRDAKEALRRLMEGRHSSGVGSHIVFLEDYDLHQAPRLVAGVDLWINLPRPPLEACGTSGMKVAMNGGLNLSVLDGWWIEAHDGACGWAIESRSCGDPSQQDDRDAEALFEILEQEVIPLFYDRGEDGLPQRWIARVKHSMARLVPRFNSERMLREYRERLYSPVASEGAAPPSGGA
jgi:starch phosphorylase